MKNRDYFKRPIQSDRMLHDYGNTKLRFDGQPKKGTIRGAFKALLLFGTGYIAVTLLVALLSTPRP